MPDISSIKLPDNSSYNVKAKKIFYAECSTAKSNVAKVVTCSGFVLEAGAMIAIRFTDTTTTTPTSGNITLNINNTGAKNIVPKGNNSVFSYGWSWAFCNNQTWLFMYNGTYFVCMNQDNNTTYNDATTSAHGLLSVADKKALDVLKTPYATCATARSTAAKVATLANFTLAIGTTIAVKFTATDTTNPTSGNLTLNVNNTGAKNIGFCRNGGKAAFNYSSAGYFSNNAIHIFTYDGTYWLCMDWNPDNNTTYSNMTAATASAAGKAGLVPAPAAGKNTAFLRGDGTWVIPTDSKVTSVGNHYTPAKSTTKSASGGTLTDITNSASGTQVVTGVEMDAKGHVTGVTSVALKSTDTRVTVDSAMSSTSTNPVQNKVINSALAGKAAASHSHTISQISDFPASLPANGGNADSCNCAKYLGTFGGSGEYYGSELPMRCVYNKFGDLKFALTTDTIHEIRVDYATNSTNADTVDGLHANNFTQLIYLGTTVTDTKTAVGQPGETAIYRCINWTDIPNGVLDGQGTIITINYKGTGTAGTDPIWCTQIFISAHGPVFIRAISNVYVGSWTEILTSGSKPYLTGVFTLSGNESKTITLGFTPSYVDVRGDATGYNINVEARITTNGFTAIGLELTRNAAVRYIAFR